MGSRVNEARGYVLELVRTGLPPGAPVSVKEMTERLRISHTPVREALERLVGEGVLVSGPDRQGFAVPRLSVRDVAGLHHLFGALLRGLADCRPVKADDDPYVPDPELPARAVEDLLDRSGRAGLPPLVIDALRTTNRRLAPYRVVEPTTVPNWREGLLALDSALVGGASAAGSAIVAFSAPRITMAGAIVAAVEDRERQHFADMSSI